MVKMVNCEIFNNKRNGVEFVNMVARYNLRNCIIRENKHSGIMIDQRFPSTDFTSQCVVCCPQSTSPDMHLPLSLRD